VKEYNYKNRLRELRKAHGFTSIDSFADYMRDVRKFPISASTLQKLESHKREDATYEIVCALADCFNVSCEYLMGVDEKQSEFDVAIIEVEKLLTKMKEIRQSKL